MARRVSTVHRRLVASSTPAQSSSVLLPLPRLRIIGKTCWTATKASKRIWYLRGRGMFRLQRRPPGAGCSFASPFTGTSEPRSVEVAVGAGASAGVRGGRGSGVEAARVARWQSIGWDRGGHFVDAHGSQLRERTGREGERSVRHCIDFQNLVARGSLFACGWGQITHRLASYGRLGHPGHLFCARARSV